MDHDEYSIELFTAREINDYFVIERRTDSDKDFIELARESASLDIQAAQHDYHQYNDYTATTNATHYYESNKQIEMDATHTVKVIALRKSKDNGLNVQLYPNPANELLNIEIQTGADAQIEIEIIDEAGRTIMTQTIDKIVSRSINSN